MISSQTIRVLNTDKTYLIIIPILRDCAIDIGIVMGTYDLFVQ